VGQENSSIDEVWTLAAESRRATTIGTPSAHDEHHDAAGLPR